jgi:hypothetical protein
MNKMKKSTKSTGISMSAREISVANLRQRWGKFNDRELKAIKTRRDLVRQIQSKYGLDKAQAQTNVDVWAEGRMFEADRRVGGG